MCKFYDLHDDSLIRVHAISRGFRGNQCHYWIVYINFNTGFKKDSLSFAIYLLTMILTTWTASAIAFFISAGVSVFALANLLVAVSYVIQMVSECL